MAQLALTRTRLTRGHKRAQQSGRHAHVHTHAARTHAARTHARTLHARTLHARCTHARTPHARTHSRRSSAARPHGPAGETGFDLDEIKQNLKYMALCMGVLQCVPIVIIYLQKRQKQKR